MKGGTRVGTGGWLEDYPGTGGWLEADCLEDVASTWEGRQNHWLQWPERKELSVKQSRWTMLVPRVNAHKTNHKRTDKVICMCLKICHDMTCLENQLDENKIFHLLIVHI